jgi:hypothetical protein
MVDLPTDLPDRCTWQESALWHRLVKMPSTALADVIIKLKRKYKIKQEEDSDGNGIFQ